MVVGDDCVGKATFVTGESGDTVSLADSDFGRLDVRMGGGNDFLGTFDCTIGAGSKYDGARGKQDKWTTTGDGTSLSPKSVEEIETFWTPQP